MMRRLWIVLVLSVCCWCSGMALGDGHFAEGAGLGVDDVLSAPCDAAQAWINSNISGQSFCPGVEIMLNFDDEGGYQIISGMDTTTITSGSWTAVAGVHTIQFISENCQTTIQTFYVEALPEIDTWLSSPYCLGMEVTPDFNGFTGQYLIFNDSNDEVVSLADGESWTADSSGDYTISFQSSAEGMCTTETSDFSVEPLSGIEFSWLQSSICIDNPITPLFNGTDGEYVILNSFDNQVSSIDTTGESWTASVAGDYAIFFQLSDGSMCRTNTVDFTVDPDFSVSPASGFVMNYCTNDGGEVNLNDFVQVTPNIIEYSSLMDPTFMVNGQQLQGGQFTPSNYDDDTSITIDFEASRGACTTMENGLFQINLRPAPIIDTTSGTELNYCEDESLMVCFEETTAPPPGLMQELTYSIEYGTTSSSLFNSLGCLSDNIGSISGTDGATFSYSGKYTYQNLTPELQCTSEGEEVEIQVTQSYDVPDLGLEESYCLEDTVNLNYGSLFPVFADFDPRTESNFEGLGSEQLTIFGMDGPMTFNDTGSFNMPGWTPYSEYTIKYILSYEHCVDSATSEIFEIRELPDSLNIKEYQCQDGEPVDLGGVVTDLSFYYSINDESFASDSGVGDIEDGVFEPNTGTIGGVQNVIINYESITYDGCLVPDSNQFIIKLHPKIETTILDDSVAFCRFMEDEIGLESIFGGNDPVYDFQWSQNIDGNIVELSEEQDDSILVLTEDFSDGWFYLHTQDQTFLDQEVYVCSKWDSVQVTLEPNPIATLTPSFSEYCQDDSSEFILVIPDSAIASGFGLDEVVLTFYDPPYCPEYNSDEQDFSSTPNTVLEWVFNSEDLQSDTLSDTLSPMDFDSENLPDMFCYSLGFIMNPEHNCPTYGPVNGDDYIYQVTTSQPRPLLSSVSDFQVCPGGTIEIDGQSNPSGDSLIWNVTDSNGEEIDAVLYQQQIEYIGDGDMQILSLTVPSGISTNIELNIELEQQSSLNNLECLGVRETTITIELSADGSPPPADIFLNEPNSYLIYNDSNLCYQWGYKKQLGEMMGYGFEAFENQTAQSLSLSPLVLGDVFGSDSIQCKVWYPDGNDNCNDDACATYVSNKSNQGGPSNPPIDPDLFSMTLHPNPNTGDFTLDLRGLREEKSYTLEAFDVMGKRVYERSIEGQEGRLTIPVQLAGLSRGVYTMRLRLPDRALLHTPFVIHR